AGEDHRSGIADEQVVVAGDHATDGQRSAVGPDAGGGSAQAVERAGADVDVGGPGVVPAEIAQRADRVVPGPGNADGRRGRGNRDVVGQFQRPARTDGNRG